MSVYRLKIKKRAEFRLFLRNGEISDLNNQYYFQRISAKY